MLKKLLAILDGSSAMKVQAEPGASAAEHALFRQIAERSKTDPLFGAKVGSKEVTQRLLTAMKTEQGVHVESLLCALGAIAGYSCQATIRALAAARGLPEASVFTLVETEDGKTFFFGDHLNVPLAESKYSVWGIAGGGAQEAGCANLPDISEIFKHVSATVGTAAFGKPRVPEGHAPQDTPLNYVRLLWPTLQPLIAKFCPSPDHWPILLGLSIQEVIVMSRNTLDPCLALQLVMECAIPMSKVNLNAL